MSTLKVSIVVTAWSCTLGGILIKEQIGRGSERRSNQKVETYVLCAVMRDIPDKKYEEVRSLKRQGKSRARIPKSNAATMVNKVTDTRIISDRSNRSFQGSFLRHLPGP